MLHRLLQISTSSCGSMIYSLKFDCKKCTAAPDLLFVYLVCMCAHCSRAWRCFWTRGASQSPWTTSYLLPLSLTSIKSSRSAGKTTFFFFFLHPAIYVCVCVCYMQHTNVGWFINYLNCFLLALLSTTGGSWPIWQICWIIANSCSLIISSKDADCLFLNLFTF